MEYPVTLMVCGKPETVFSYQGFLELVRTRMGDEAAAFADFSEEEEEFQKIQTELDDAESRILELEDELENLAEERDSLQRKNDSLNQKIQELAPVRKRRNPPLFR